MCDRAAELIILAALAAAAPGVPVIAEEEVAAGRIPAHGDTYFLVDPLDGTKEFVRGGDDYTVNIGLIVGGSPRLGVVYQPALDRLARRAGRRGRVGSRRAASARADRYPRARRAARRGRLQVALQPGDRRLSRRRRSARATMSRSARSLKFCIVAEGQRRHLSAPVADQRVGHGRRPCRAARRGRAGRRARRRAAALWQDRLPQPRLLRHRRAGRRRRSRRSSSPSPAAATCPQGV